MRGTAPPVPPVQIERAVTRVRAGAEAFHPLRAQFDRRHWVRLPGLLAGPLLQVVQRGMATARFVEIRHGSVTPPSVDVCMEPNATSAMLELVCNDPPFRAVVEALTGCAPLARFSGFVYRMLPGAGHHHNWHNDLIQERRVAMSINLEAEPYGGGVLQIRDRESGRILEEVSNTGPGDAVLFRIDATLQHRVLPVTSGAKTAFAGWFRAEDPLLAALREGRT